LKTDYEHHREVAMPLKTVATQLLEKAGVDVGEFADLAVRDAASGLATFHYCIAIIPRRDVRGRASCQCPDAGNVTHKKPIIVRGD
jgi:hypothetical protein